MKTRPIVIIAVFSLATAWSTAAAAVTPEVQEALSFRIDKAPSPQDWRYFLKAPERYRQTLWTTQVQQGRRLGDWAWEWRLGWLRACGASVQPYCLDVLKAGLADRALVVRAEAATWVGGRFEGTDDPDMAAALTQAFQDARNLRNGRPMYVQNRILQALFRLGAKAGAAGARLAAGHPQTQRYWSRLGADAPGIQSKSRL